MQGGNNYGTLVIELELSSERGDSLLRAQKNLSGKFAQAADDPGMEDFYLSFQIGKAGLNFFRKRVPITRGSALKNIGNIYVFVCQPRLCQFLSKEFSCCSYEGSALQILLSSRCLSYQHYFCLRASPSENQMGPGPIKGAPSTGQD